MERISRRNFIKLAGTTGAVLALNPGCDSINKFLPYVNPPQYALPGEWIHYASTCRECPAGCGMHLRHRDGRVIKADGNPKNPINNGRLCARGQSSVQGQYDPDRLKDVINQNRGQKPKVSSWDKALKDIAGRITRPGTRVIVISDLQTGSLAEVLDTFSTAVGNGSYTVYYEPFNYEPLRKANRMITGSNNIPRYNLDSADYVISFAADYLETWISPVEYANRFSRLHSFNNDNIGKSAYIGPRFSLTAANSDKYIQTPAGKEGLAAFAMLKHIIENHLAKNNIAQALPYINSVLEGEKIPADQKEIEALVNDFINAPNGIALAGVQVSNSASEINCAAAAWLLNYSMGRIGSQVETDRPHALSKTIMTEQLESILSGISQNDVIIINNANLVYSYPGSSEYIKKAGLVVYMGTMVNETASYSDWMLPLSYYFESWGDYEPYSGMTGIIQPAMNPLYKTRSVGDVLIAIAHDAGRELRRIQSGQAHSNFYDWFIDHWRSVHQQSAPQLSFDDFFQGVLRNGGLWNYISTQRGTGQPSVNFANLKAGNKTSDENSLKLWFWPEITLFDGRFSNRGWMQEIPEPVSFVSWNSWIDISQSLAEKFKLSNNDIVELESGGVKIEVPVNIIEGVKEDTIALPFGQGHTALGYNAKDRGVNAFRLLAANNFSNPVTGINIRRTEKHKPLAYMAETKEQHSRKVIEWIELEKLRDMAPEDAEHLVLPLSEGYQPDRDLYPAHYYKVHRWAMTIDLQACIGCAACTAACYAENNIPVVGEKEVERGRELTWMKVVPYRDDEDKHKLGWIPMLCQHCDAAPCEPVCPVFAAVHNEEGLNAQIYNRCIGTRYCSNNCPYKVRRFNWFDPEFKAPLERQLNPEVTVRSRGVMEKCTFCVQRIKNAEYHAKNEGRKLAEGEIVTACQQTCPTNAIVFGDLLDNNSQVSKITRNDKRRYHVLEDLNTKPAVTYLKRISVE